MLRPAGWADSRRRKIGLRRPAACRSLLELLPPAPLTCVATHHRGVYAECMGAAKDSGCSLPRKWPQITPSNRAIPMVPKVRQTE